MTVGCILSRKGRDVTTAQQDATLRQVAETLASRHIGALLIVDGEGAMIGIVSERDIVRAIAADGAEALDARAADVMTRNVVTATEDDDVIATAQRMTQGRFRHMPVMKEGRISGIISTGDAIKYRLEQMEQEHSALKDYIATA